MFTIRQQLLEAPNGAFAFRIAPRTNVESDVLSPNPAAT